FAARRVRVTLELWARGAPGGRHEAVAARPGARVGGVLVLTDPMFDAAGRRLAQVASASGFPAIYGFRTWVDVGGLRSYGPDLADLFHRAATYVDKILKGAKPGDLPIEQPTKFELVINLKTANALALTIPQSLPQRADDVI